MSPLPNFPNESPSSPPDSPEKSFTKPASTGKSRLPHSSSMNSLGGRPGSAFSEDTTAVQNDGIVVSVEEMDCARNKLAANVAQIDSQSCGLPLSIFTKVCILFFSLSTPYFYIYPQGYLCHPYLSLPYMDMLSDVNVRGYIIGATNVLFKQKNQLADVLVEV
jgi:Transport protein Avl9